MLWVFKIQKMNTGMWKVCTPLGTCPYIAPRKQEIYWYNCRREGELQVCHEYLETTLSPNRHSKRESDFEKKERSYISGEGKSGAWQEQACMTLLPTSWALANISLECKNSVIMFVDLEVNSMLVISIQASLKGVKIKSPEDSSWPHIAVLSKTLLNGKWNICSLLPLPLLRSLSTT